MTGWALVGLLLHDRREPPQRGAFEKRELRGDRAAEDGHRYLGLPVYPHRSAVAHEVETDLFWGALLAGGRGGLRGLWRAGQ